MEIAIFGLLFAFALYWMEERDRGRMFPHQKCRDCEVWIHWDRRRHSWMHDDGTYLRPTVGVEFYDWEAGVSRPYMHHPFPPGGMG